MGLLSGEKRKNDAPRKFQWWLLVIGIALGIVIGVMFTPSRTQPGTVFSDGSGDSLFLTATAIIVAGTSAAQSESASNPSASLEPLAMTATYIVGQATQQAAMSTQTP